LKIFHLPAGGRHILSVACVLVAILAALPSPALDLFTLWRQPEIPLTLEAGAWVDYRTQVMAAGRRENGILRVVCIRADEDEVVLELLPLEELRDGILTPVPGNGARVSLDGSVRKRKGSLLGAVRGVRHWQDGQARDISPEELRDDPLVSTSFTSDFQPDTVESRQTTTRIVSGLQFSCRQWVMASADTQSVVMPAGRMNQITTREVAAAVHEDIPFLGLVYASERVRASASLDPPSRGVPLPPERHRVEVMELVGFGRDAKPTLVGGD